MAVYGFKENKCKKIVPEFEDIYQRSELKFIRFVASQGKTTFQIPYPTGMDKDSVQVVSANAFNHAVMDNIVTLQPVTITGITLSSSNMLVVTSSNAWEVDLTLALYTATK